jgi:type I restriction enzyme S subunit
VSGEELPEGWATAKVSAVAELCLGKMLDKDKNRGELRPYLRNISVRWGAFELNDLPTMRFEDHELDRYGLQRGDVVVCEGGEPGRCAVWRTDTPMLIQKALHRVRCREVMRPDFFAQQLRWDALSGRLSERFTGTTIQHLPGVALAEHEVAVPPVGEQARIVARLDALQARSRAAREALAEVPALLDTFRQSVLASAFRGDLTAEWRAKNPDVEPASKLLERIRAERKTRWKQANPKKKYVEPEPVDESGLPELPEGWVWAKLEELVASISYGYTASASTDPAGRAFLRITDLTDAGVNWDTVPYCPAPADGRYDLKTGDIVVARTGATTGKSYRLSNPPRGAVFASYLIRLEALDGCPSEYVAGFMKGPSYWTQITTLAKGTAQPGANATVLGGVVVPLCPREEMPTIIEAANAILAGVEGLASEGGNLSADLDTLDQSILARAFRGDLVDQDPNDEPAEVLLARIRSGGDAPPARGRARRS